MGRNILIASFIFKDRFDWFKTILTENFDVRENQIQIFETGDEYKYLVTFKLSLSEDRRIDFKKEFPNATIVHKKKSTIYSINGLNKLIEKTHNIDLGNIDYKSVKLDWSKYENKLILMRSGQLVLSDIKPIF